MHAFFLGTKVLLASFLIAGRTRAVHQLIPAVLVCVGLNMAPRDNFLAPFTRERTPHRKIIAHVGQKSGNVEIDIPRRSAACGTGEVVSAGSKSSDSKVQARLAKHMVAS
ncbi:hypothetical protein BDW60DRAFT_68131 [Aspergillus nidulans var. acristatus]